MQNNTNIPQDLAGYIQHLKSQPLQKIMPVYSKTISTPQTAALITPLADVKANWILARDNYLNHIMRCRLCVVAGLKQPRYCAVGEKHHHDYQCATDELIEYRKHDENQPSGERFYFGDSSQSLR